MIALFGLAWILGITYAIQTPPFPFHTPTFDHKYGRIDEDDLVIAREQAREMFYFGYNNYLNHAFPLDELDPIHCTGRGHDYKNPYGFGF